MMCAIRWYVLVLLSVFVALFAFAVGYGLGRRRQINKHFQMLHRVSSRFAEGDKDR